MANYTTVRNRTNAYNRAAALLPQLQAIYQQAQAVQSALGDYNANTNPDFNAAIDSIFSTNERTQLAAMLTSLNSLVTTWGNNNAALLATETT